MSEYVWKRVEGGWYTCDALRKSLIYATGRNDVRPQGWYVYPWGTPLVAGPYKTLQAAQDAAADPATKYVKEPTDEG